MNEDDFRGLKTAAEILLRRLRQKDYRKWLEVVALSPPELLGHSGNELPPLTELGAAVKDLCDRGLVRLEAGKDGVVRGRAVKNVADRHRPCTR